jgi:hypothetical protein
VPDHVCKRFLDDAIGGRLDIWREAPFRDASMPEIDINPACAEKPVEMPVKGGNKTQVVKHRGTQIEGHLAHELDEVVDATVGLLEDAGGSVGGHAGAAIEVELERGQFLANVVVEFARDVPALGFLDGDEAARKQFEAAARGLDFGEKLVAFAVGALALTDIADHDLDATPAIERDGLGGNFNVGDRAIASHGLDLVPGLRGLAVIQALEAREHNVVKVRMNELHDWQVDEVVSDTFAEGSIGEDDFSVDVNEDAVRTKLDKLAVALFAFAQSLLGLFAVSDINKRYDGGRKCPRLIKDRQRAENGPSGAAIGTLDTQRGFGLGLTRGETAGNRIFMHRTFAAILVDNFAVKVTEVSLREVVVGKTKEFNRNRVGEGNGTMRINLANTRGHRLEDPLRNVQLNPDPRKGAFSGTRNALFCRHFESNYGVVFTFTSLQ